MRIARVAGVTSVLGCLVMATAAAGGASPSADVAESSEVAAGDISDGIADAASDLMMDLYGTRGFVNVEVDPQEITVWWHGEVPLWVKERVAWITYPVEVRDANFSSEQLEAGHQTLLASYSDMELESLAVEFVPDGSGIIITVNEDSSAANLDPEELTERLHLGVPIVRIETVPPLPEHYDLRRDGLYQGRSNDTGSLEGGSQILVMGPGGGIGACGAGMSATRHSNGARVMATADHCFEYSAGAWAPNGTSRGTRVQGSALYDVALLGGYNTYASWVWRGSHVTTVRYPNGTTRAPVINQHGCLSGSISGQICQIKTLATVSSVTITPPGGPTRTWYNLIRAERIAPGGAGAGGDSGSPLLRWTATTNHSYGEVGRPYGLMIGPLNLPERPNRDCQGFGVNCANRLYYSNLWLAELNLGFTVVGTAP